MRYKLGLSKKEARELLEKFGYNEIIEKPRQTSLQIFFSQFTSILVILLIFASIASLFLGDVLDGVFILLIVLLNGILGFAQEYKAEKAIKALKKMTVSTVRVVRDGIEQEIDSRLLVPGDIIILEEGDKIPADCNIVESVHFEVNEASLTGESMPVEKDEKNEEKRYIFMGTVVVKGRAKAVVVETGMRTRFGKIAGALSAISDEETPLQKKLSVVGRQLGFLAIASSITVFFIGFMKNYSFIEMILASISLAVAAVPEGLPAVITIALAVGMQRMAGRKAILRRLSSIESLGGITVIATDKTGTLTKNEMRVEKIWFDGKSHISSDIKLDFNNMIFRKLLLSGIICNNASLFYNQDRKSYGVLGDTTEGALLILAKEKGVDIEKVKQDGRLIDEFAFDPEVKMMTVVWEHKGQKIIYTKGAPESVLEKSDVDRQTRKQIEKAFHEYAKNGLRVIALAYKHVREIPQNRQEAEKNLSFIGFVGISDPPRKEVKDAISLAKQAGIKTIMITGDNELTAKAIGLQIGLIEKNEKIISGKQLEKLSDEDAIKIFSEVLIFARTNPDQKLRIVRLLQKMNQTVAVTGDGVNDALALKQADVGVAMGITGTDVAKEASDMIITDDNYATLVSAVEEGRVIFENIKSAVKYLIGCNIGEVVAVIAGMIFGWPLILTPLQLLYINLVTDGLPAIALSVTPKHKDIMKRKPRMFKKIFDRIDFFWLLEVSILTALTTLIAFWVGERSGGLELARTLAFTTIILVQQFILLDVWVKEDSFAQKRVLSNKVFLLAFLTPLILQIPLLYVPFLSNIFKITHITLIQLFFVVSLSLMILLSSEIRKVILLNFKNKKENI